MVSESTTALASKIQDALGMKVHVSFSCSGSEANETAFKIARQYHQQSDDPNGARRYKILSRYRAYHGATFGAMTLTGDPRRWANEPGLVGVVRYPDTHRWGEAEPRPVAESLQGLEDVIRYEGPRGGPGMQEMLYPTSYLKSKDLGKACALITDGRFSGGTSGLSIGHVSPEAAAGGAIALIEPGDIIEINIPERQINVLLDEATLAGRRDAMNHRARAWKPVDERPRKVSTALKVYASMVTSADKGAIRDSSLIDG